VTELAIPETNQPATIQAPQQQPTTELMQWVESARQAYLVAESIAKTSFAGALRGKPDEITAAILAGQELGLKPMTTLKSIDVIQGTPALRAHAMRGLIQSHGHEIELVESSDTHCVMRGRRKGAETWQTVEWDIPRAQRLGLLGKDQWKKQPKTMLIARATGEICRLIASDALHGMPHAAEELRDSDTTTYEMRPAAPRLSVAALTAAPQAAPIPTPTPTAPAADTDEDDSQDGSDALWDAEAEADSQPWPTVAEIPN
jgi:hypothetical protein